MMRTFLSLAILLVVQPVFSEVSLVPVDGGKGKYDVTLFGGTKVSLQAGPFDYFPPLDPLPAPAPKDVKTILMKLNEMNSSYGRGLAIPESFDLRIISTVKVENKSENISDLFAPVVGFDTVFNVLTLGISYFGMSDLKFEETLPIVAHEYGHVFFHNALKKKSPKFAAFSSDISKLYKQEENQIIVKDLDSIKATLLELSKYSELFADTVAVVDANDLESMAKVTRGVKSRSFSTCSALSQQEQEEEDAHAYFSLTRCEIGRLYLASKRAGISSSDFLAAIFQVIASRIENSFVKYKSQTTYYLSSLDNEEEGLMSELKQRIESLMNSARGR